MDIEKVADEIVDYLFENGAGQRARRLVLELADGKNGGGWSRQAVRATIISKLKALAVIGVTAGAE